MRRLLVATHNSHKTTEIQAMLGTEFACTDLNAHPEITPTEETGSTFVENATLKALAAAPHFAGLVLADDSGLEVDALNGAPGVRSARYAGENASDAENRAKLLRALQTLGPRQFPARFRCAMVLVENGNVLGHFEGAVEGLLLPEERGVGGFGYDSLFMPVGYEETFAQLSGAIKNQLSHRARALQQALHFLTSKC